MSECKKSDERGGDSVGIVLFVGLIVSVAGLLLFFCVLNGLSQQAHRNSGYQSQKSTENYNRGVEDGVLGYYLFGGSGKRK
jgi:hypothetical protein